MKIQLVLFLLCISFLHACSDDTGDKKEASLLIHNGKIWTGNDDQPWASWVLVEGEYVKSVGKEGEDLPAADQVINLEGRLTVPGFNDSHVHFQSAGALLLGINLLDVNDQEGLI